MFLHKRGNSLFVGYGVEPFCCAVGGDAGTWPVGISSIGGRVRAVMSNGGIIGTDKESTGPECIVIGQTIINGLAVNGELYISPLTSLIFDEINNGGTVYITVEPAEVSAPAPVALCDVQPVG
jgi:hypothetical protein